MTEIGMAFRSSSFAIVWSRGCSGPQDLARNMPGGSGFGQTCSEFDDPNGEVYQTIFELIRL